MRIQLYIRRLIWQAQMPSPLDYVVWRGMKDEEKEAFWNMPKEYRMRRYQLKYEQWKAREPK